jgi:WD40 repeat protein/serine/threonine protein kinase
MTEPSLPEESIFLQALEIPSAAERAAYLDRAYGEDRQLRAAVEALLRAHEKSGDVLDLPEKPMPTVDDPITERPGTVIGPYKLLQQIGEGGMGIVFMAEQTHPVRRKVAVKVIKAGMGTRQVIARFEAERQALAMMDHVNIARVLDVGTTEAGRPYFVMELVHGIPITQYCDQRRLTPRERLELLIPVCQAIQHAHQKGIIHRDVKPSNVMVTLYDGQPVPKVIDFGVAKATEQKLTERTLFTQYGTLVGTLEYMSPEQAEMSALGVDTRSDIYSLGVLLYELLTGSTPLSRERLKEAAYGEILRMIKEEEPPKPSTRLSDTGQALASISAQRQMEPVQLTKLVRGELDWIVMKCLEKDRNRRYEAANALALDLQRYLHDEPVQACPPSAGYRFRKFVKRHKVGLAAAAAVQLALLGWIGLAVWSNWRISQALEDKETERSRAVAAQEQAVAETYRSLVNQTQALRLGRPPGWRDTALANLHRLLKLETPQRDTTELRGEAIVCEVELDVRPFRRLPSHTTRSVWSLEFSPDGKTLVTSGYDGNTSFWDVNDGKLVKQIGDPTALQVDRNTETAHLPAVRFRPDGSYLAYATGRRTVELVGLASANPPFPRLEGQSQARFLAFDRKGSLLAVGWGDGQVAIHDAATGARRRLIQTGANPSNHVFRPLAFSPDSAWLAAMGPDHAVQLHKVAEGEEPVHLGQHREPVRSLCFSPDGNYVASASEDRSTKLWDVRTRKEYLTLQGHTAVVNSAAFSPIGDLVATVSDDQSLRLWDSRTGQALMVLHPDLPDPDSLLALAFSPDGTRLATGRTTVGIFQLTGHGVRQRLTGHGHRGNISVVVSLAFHPTEDVLASGGADRQIILWRTSTGRPLHHWHGSPENPIGGLAFSPDGELLAAGPYETMTPSPSSDSSIYVLETRTGKPRHRFPWQSPGERPPGPWADVEAVAFDPQGKLLAGVANYLQPGETWKGLVMVWNIVSGEVVARWPYDQRIRRVAFLNQGTQLVLGLNDGRIQIRSVAGGTMVRERVSPRGLFDIAVSPDERHLAVAGWEATTIHRLADLQATATLENAHKGVVAAVAYASDMRLLATGGNDRNVILWDGRTYRRLATLPVQPSGVTDLAFEPNGSRLAISGKEEFVTVWDLRRVRDALAELGLDWDHPPLPAPR